MAVTGDSPGVNLEEPADRLPDVVECERLKKEGNEVFTAGHIEEALELYRKALKYAPLKPAPKSKQPPLRDGCETRGDNGGTSPSSGDAQGGVCGMDSVTTETTGACAAEAEGDEKDGDFTDYTLTSQVYCNAGLCLAKLGSPDDAVTHLSEAIRHNAKYTKAYLRRADCYYTLEKWSNAYGDYEEYEKLGGTLDPIAQGRKRESKAKVDEEMQKMLGELKGLGNRFLNYFGLSTDNFKFDKDPNTAFELTPMSGAGPGLNDSDCPFDDSDHFSLALRDSLTQLDAATGDISIRSKAKELRDLVEERSKVHEALREKVKSRGVEIAKLSEELNQWNEMVEKLQRRERRLRRLNAAAQKRRENLQREVETAEAMQRELSDKCCRPSAPAGRAASQPFATKPVSESRSRAGPSQRDETSEATCPPPARQDERDLQGKLRDARSKYRRICAENERLKLALDDIAVLLTPRVRDGGSGGACGVPLGYNAALQELVASLQEVTDSMAPSR